MSNKLKNLSLIIVTFILIILFTPFFGDLYEKYFGPVSYGFFIGPENPQYVDGFFIAYAFFATLVVTLFITKKKYKILGYFLGALLLVDLFIGYWEGLIIDFSVALVAFILAQLILLGYKKLKK